MIGERSAPHDVFDGGKGTDTLQLELTHAQFASAAVQADLAAFQRIPGAQREFKYAADGPTFHFTRVRSVGQQFRASSMSFSVNAPVVITSGPESASVAELAEHHRLFRHRHHRRPMPAGTLNFHRCGYRRHPHRRGVACLRPLVGRPSIPAATQADLAAALTTTLHNSTGTGTGSIDWNFGHSRQGSRFSRGRRDPHRQLQCRGQRRLDHLDPDRVGDVTGANDAGAITSGPESASVAE